MIYLKIYIGHSREFDYVNELYKPIRNDDFFLKYDVILPHEKEVPFFNRRSDYKNVDVFIADVSFPSTGLGIELGFLYDDNKKIYCIVKKGNMVSQSIRAVTDNIYEYENVSSMIDIIKEIIIENDKSLENKHII